VLALPTALERFERISGRRSQLVERFDGVRYQQLPSGLSRYRSEAPDQLIAKQSFGIAIAEALDRKPT
jgi:hypothetical protein